MLNLRKAFEKFMCKTLSLVNLQISRVKILWKIVFFTGTFQRFFLDFNKNFYSDWLSMAASDDFSWLCGKNPKQKSVLSERFVYYLSYSNIYFIFIIIYLVKSLINYLNWLAQLLRTNELEDARIQLFICIENTLTWGCEHTSKHT